MFVSTLLFAFLALFQPLLASIIDSVHDASGIKFYDLELTWESYAPDGFSRKMLLVNGQSPGPVLRFNQDDWVVVHVSNKSPCNTTIHFHGELPTPRYYVSTERN